MTDRPSQPYLFPRALYGTTRETRAAWTKISRRVAKSGDWEAVLAETEFVDVRDFPGEIVINRAYYGGARNPHADHWRLYHSINFDSLYKPSAGQDLDADRHAQVIVDGMRYLWFALAMYGISGGDFPIDHQMTDRALAAQFTRLVADSLVGWLGYIVELSGQLATAGIEPENEVINSGQCWWLGAVVSFACQATNRGGTIDRWWEKVNRTFGGDGVGWLISTGLIERTNGGYRIRYVEQPDNNARQSGKNESGREDVSENQGK